MAGPAKVNYIRHLNTFFRLVKNDDRLRATDVSIYVALFQIWNMHNFRHSFPAARKEVIRFSRVGSRSTYVECIKRLHACGYIVYQKPTQKGFPGTIRISLLEERQQVVATQLKLFEEEDNGPDSGHTHRPETGHTHTPDNGQSTGLKTGPLYKHVNNDKVERKEKATRAKKNESLNQSNAITGTPRISEVQEYFRSVSQPDKEAKKFFHHYDAIGWTMSGEPIVKWQSAANKWIENIHTLKKTNNDKQGRLHVDPNKSYKNTL